MPKRKASAWPASILADPDVLSLDDEGRFVLCKICHVHYAVHGGKKPKPVVLNANFRTRAWEVHKERTTCHRLQSEHERVLRQRARQQQQQQQQIEEQKQQQQAEQRQEGEQEGKQESDAPEPDESETKPPVSQAAPLVEPVAAAQHLWDATTQPVPVIALFQVEAQVRGYATQLDGPPPSSPPADRKQTVQDAASETENEGSSRARWQHMHADVTRALHVAPLKRHKDSQADNPDNKKDREAASQVAKRDGKRSTSVYTRRELRVAATLAETQGFSGNRDKVARKLKALSEQYDVSRLRPEDTAGGGDSRNADARTFGDTFPDVYTSTGTGLDGERHSRREYHRQRHNDRSRAINPGSIQAAMAADSGITTIAVDDADSTTPGISSNTSEDPGQRQGSAALPQNQPSGLQVAHDATLVRAFDRLTGVVSAQLTDMFVQEARGNRTALEGLTTAVSELGAHQEQAFDRLIRLQEQHVDMMEEILQHKLWKESRLLREEEEHDEEQKGENTDETIVTKK